MAVSIVLVLPVGPGTPPEFVIDTIESYRYYAHEPFEIVLADDSHQGIGKIVKKILPDCHIIQTKKPMGGWAGLYITLSEAFRFAIENFSFKAILKMDTDALVIGPGPETEALELFRSDAAIGMAGQYPLTYDGEPWNIAWPRQRIINSTRSWKFIARPLANYQLIKYHKKAVNNGYITGESVFGGSYFISAECLERLSAEGLLPSQKFKSLNLGEDHLFSLLVKSMGFNLHSLSGTGGTMGLGWKGLPAAPAQLIADGKKIIHSTREWSDWSEKDIRTFYKSRRTDQAVL